jgi:outer membrane receptor for ferrienterochelin and colicins
LRVTMWIEDLEQDHTSRKWLPGPSVKTESAFGCAIEGKEMASLLKDLIRRTAVVNSGLLFFFCLNLVPVFAQNDPEDLTMVPLEELNKMQVYSASKFSQKVTEAPASISIVTAAEIQRYGYRTLAEILSSVTGLFSTSDRNYEYVGARGFGRTGDYNTRILFLLNGMRLNDSLYGGTGIGTDFPVSVDLIDRIEIVRGPGSSLYGTNAFFGTINVITKRGADFSGGYVTADAGSLNTYSGTASYGRKFDSGVELLISASARNAKGQRRLYYSEFDTPETNNGIAEDLDTGSNAGFYANASFRGLTAQLVFNTRDKGIPTASYGTAFNDRKEQTADTTGFLDLKFERGFRKNWSILARTYFATYDYSGTYGYEYSGDDTAYISRNLDFASGRWWGGEFQLTRTLAQKHHLTAGVEWQDSRRARQKNYDAAPVYTLYLDTDNPWSMGGAYLEGEFALRDNLLLTTGFRHDHYTTFGGSTNPRFALVYSPEPKSSVKLLYGNAFRAPNNYEMRYEDGYSQRTNPALQPEKIKTTEIVLEHHFGQRFRAAGSAYHYRVDGLISEDMDADNLSIFRNLGNISANGIELEFEGKNFHGFDGRISYAVQRARARDSSESLVNSPQHIAQLSLFVPCFRTKGGLGIEMRYMSSRKTTDDLPIGGFLLTNITLLHKKLLPNLDFSAGIYNLFDKRYADPAGEEHMQHSILQDGRTFRVRLGYAIASR